MTSDVQLQADGLSVELDSDAGLVHALDALRLSLQRGETFALVGESGCGKSITALALMRLLPDAGRIAAGRVTLAGTPLLELPERQMRRVRGGRVGMIFQEPATSLNPVMRVGDQLIEAIEEHTPLRGDAARTKAIAWLQRVGLPDAARRIDAYPFQLSGGQKQRVMIAMALAAEPDFLLADEPTTALDVTIQAQILDLLQALQRDEGLGLLLITHDLAVVAGRADRVALMYAGQIVEVASADAFFAAPKHPYARLLLQALPGVAAPGESLAAIPGSVPPLTQTFTGCRFASRCDRVMPRCHGEVPSLIELGDGRSVRCWLYEAGAVRADEGSVHMEETVHLPALTPTLSERERGQEVPLLSVHDLHVRFPIRQGLLRRVQGHVTAVDGISFDIHRGETLALVGESGCGKTTTGKAIVQLLRRQAELQGQAIFDGQDLFALQGEDLRRARRQVQIIFQDPFASLDPRMRVADILDEGLRSLCPELDTTARAAQLHTLVDRVGLRRDALQRYPHEFSGGQRQRIAIARALSVSPRLIVCDEPTSALDVSVQAQVLNLMTELQRELGVAYLFITHNLAVVEHLAQRVVVMRAGRVEESGEASQVLHRPRAAYTKMLLDAVPRIGVRPNTAAR
jgi:peptide/nickel transport system ATP-binding protein